MNDMAKQKIEAISTNLHKYARTICPKYLNSEPCEGCDIECPFDQIDTLLYHIKRNEVALYIKK
jgi:hypothetical protein